MVSQALWICSAAGGTTYGLDGRDLQLYNEHFPPPVEAVLNMLLKVMVRAAQASPDSVGLG